MQRRFFSYIVGGALTIGAIVAGRHSARAEEPELALKRERCATRLAIALTGKSADASLLASADPVGAVNAMLEGPDFIELYASFINSALNRSPGPAAVDDATYWMAKYVLEKKRPWKEVFVGAYNLKAGADNAVEVVADPKGLGYFRTDAWMRKYAGNEGEGIRLAAAYLMISNTVGVKLVPVLGDDKTDNSAKGREGGACRGCHYDSWFALDKIASVLSVRDGNGPTMKFLPQRATSATVLDGATVSGDSDVLRTLVDSEQFLDEQCRLAFKFLYGRPENSCEGTVLDSCVDALKTQGTIQPGLSAMVRAPLFCQ